MLTPILRASQLAQTKPIWARHTPGQHPPLLNEAEPLVELPAEKLMECQPRQDTDGKRRGAGRFGDLPRAVEGGQAGLLPPCAWNKKLVA